MQLPQDQTGEGPLDLWPDNEAPVELFGRACTQWNFGAMGGATGLRYEALPFLMRLQDIRRTDQAEVMDCLQIMEVHALSVMNKRKG